MLLKKEEFAYTNCQHASLCTHRSVKNPADNRKQMRDVPIIEHVIVPKQSENKSHPLKAEIPLDQILQTDPSETTSACCSHSFCQNPFRKGHGQIALMQQRVQEKPEMSMWNVSLQSPGGCVPHHDSGPTELCTRPAQVANTDVFREYSFHLECDEEELERPLPLRSDDEWQHYNPYSHMQHYGGCHSFCSRFPPQTCSHSVSYHNTQTWHHSPYPNWLPNQELLESPSLVPCSVSVNVPHFSEPPAGGVLQASVGEVGSGSCGEKKRDAMNLPDECRNIFITHSSDASSDIMPFAEFLTKQGFRPTIDIFDSPVSCMDINSWRDGFLKDPSTLIIIAISPKYKSDVEGRAADNHGLHTKYIHSVMQNEFIQQGCLNFRFIPVLFLNASQQHVPSWLQNTRVYRWPHHADDLLLRLLRMERYAPPPVAMELSVIIKPVAVCPTDPSL